ncbi:MAG TPA: 3-dehydroquinate synthase [Clostridiaceae bacterium]|nr:3-dehydroquinate synthase [Clostridiaceae bacterium]
MSRVDIRLKEKSYPIYIEDSYEHLPECISASGISGKIMIITDSNVDALQYHQCYEALKGCNCEIYKYVMAPGEENKTLDTIKEIYSCIKKHRFERNSVILALGGGVVGDVSGFAASTYLRGINFIQVPTTLLAQADSSVGGKVGVDFEGSKNMVGAFYQPRLVYINVNSLKTLPRRQLISGMAEVVKHGLIMDREFFEYIEKNIDKILALDVETLKYIAGKNCSLKGSIVEQDEKETGLRAILNFGHTIGHAIESKMDFTLLHGECVSIGMVGAFKLACRLGMTSQENAERVAMLLERLGLPVNVSGPNVDGLYNQMFFDKKVKDGRLLFVLPRDIGKVERLFINDENLIKQVLGEIII